MGDRRHAPRKPRATRDRPARGRRRHHRPGPGRDAALRERGRGARRWPVGREVLLAMPGVRLMERFEVVDEDGEPFRSSGCPAAERSSARARRRRSSAGASGRRASSTGRASGPRRFRGRSAASRSTSSRTSPPASGRGRAPAARRGGELLAESLDYERTLRRSPRSPFRGSGTGAWSTRPRPTARSAARRPARARPAHRRARSASALRVRSRLADRRALA